MPRRKRASLDSSISEEQIPNKRARKKENEVISICHEIFDCIKNHKTENGFLTFNLFMKLPHKRSEPKYFEIIKNPIDLLMIFSKIKNEEYNTLDEMTADIKLLVDNATLYYEDDSEEKDLANQFLRYYNEIKEEKVNEQNGISVSNEKNNDSEEEVNSSEDIKEICEEMFDAIAISMDGDRFITEMFKVLPSKVKFPDYYNVIEEPLDLRTVAKRVQSSQYESLDSMVRDLMVIVNNARTYNQPGSTIYKDAVLLKKTVQAKKIELDTLRQARRSSHRMRSAERRVHVGPRHSMAYASLPSPNDETDNETDDNEDFSFIAGTGALWSLFNTIANHRTADGRRMCEPFLRLPSKRLYPDYYDEIQNPISLFHIKKKIKNNMYAGDVVSLSSDLELLFKNAQKYNLEDSQLFQDAVALHKIMRDKCEALYSLCDPGYLMPISLPQSINMASYGVENEDSMNSFSAKRSSRELLQKKIYGLFRTISDYEIDGRSLIEIFLVLPSKDEFPDYYQVISEPIDMETIESRLENYETLESLAEDMELMFRNARHYNEENSQVYKDAVILERVLKTKLQSLTASNESPKSKTPLSSTRLQRRDSKSTVNKWNNKLQTLYSFIKDATDKNNRILSTPFMRLPSKNEYPDYYDVIKKPIDMLKIGHKLSLYDTLDDLLADFSLMFDNACKYNEPDSLIYKDALALLKLAFDKKSELEKEDSDETYGTVPDVKLVIRNLMKELMRSVLSFTGSQNRCLSESLANLPYDDDESICLIKKTLSSLDKIGKRIEKEMYNRLDKLQEDVFELFDYARSISAVDSQIFNDACELQTYFVQRRDELCGLGGIFFSPALAYTQRRVTDEIDKEKMEKIKMRKARRNHDKSDEKDPLVNFIFNDITYSPGDFCYFIPENGIETNLEILLIEKIYESDGCTWIDGNKFLKPHQTFHVKNKMFLEQEVFKSDVKCSIKSNQIRGKCLVLPIKVYTKMYCSDFPEEHTWLCDKRYFNKLKTFRTIKSWTGTSYSKLTQRPNQIQPAKIKSVFANGKKDSPTCSSSNDEDDFDDEEEFDPDGNRIEVPIESGTAPPGVTMYEQLNYDNCGWLKLGDFVYVKDDVNSSWRIIRAEQLWTDAESMAHVSGAQFVQPLSVEHSPTRLFYAKEVVRNADASVPMSKVTGTCCVLFFKEYCSQRPTMINEDDLWLCESKFIPDEKIVKKLTKPMKKITLSSRVLEDEVFFLKKPYYPKRVTSPFLKQALVDVGVDESYAIPPSLLSASTPNPSETTPKLKNKIYKRPKQLSGYIVFAGEYRKGIQRQNPSMNFGDISRLVGAKWKELPKDEREVYEERAKKIAQEQSVLYSNSSVDSKPSTPAPSTITTTVAGLINNDSNSQDFGACSSNVNEGSNLQCRSTSPLFVAVPPRTQRILHSEAYLRYIEGLNNNTDSVGPWRKELSSKSNNAVTNSQKLPTNWLSTAAIEHGKTVTQALWALRDQLLQDAVNIGRRLDFDQL